jgi:hypothetical protein
MKELSEQMDADPKRSRTTNKTAVELGIQYTRFDGELRFSFYTYVRTNVF